MNIKIQKSNRKKGIVVMLIQFLKNEDNFIIIFPLSFIFIFICLTDIQSVEKKTRK